MRIAIVEDDKKDMEQLVDVIKAYAAGHEISLELDTFASGEDFLRAFAPQKYKLIFFDNYIGSGLGIDLARKARELDNDVEFVFVSMSMEFALSGYEVRALHYLIKPATFGEIEKIFERLWRNTSKPQESYVVGLMIFTSLRLSSTLFLDNSGFASMASTERSRLNWFA